MQSPDQASDPFENAYLTAYPNPERVGCPDKEVLRGLATKELPIGHPARLHIAQCSPCFQEFRQLERTAKKQRSRIRRAVLVAAAAFICLAAAFSYRLLLPDLGNSPRVIAEWNLQSASALRGIDDYQQPVHLQAPRRKGRIAIVLPLGSEGGQYVVELRKNRDASSVMKTFTNQASISRQGYTTLEVNGDLSNVQSGTYVVAFRHDRGSWHFAQLSVQ